MIELMLQKDMTSEQKAMFQNKYNEEKKDVTVAILLALFLGGLGAHRFYLRQYGLGILYVLFVWTFIPSIVALFELFVLSSRVKRYNEQKAQEIALQVKNLA